jgi:hypothetical protein
VGANSRHFSLGGIAMSGQGPDLSRISSSLKEKATCIQEQLLSITQQLSKQVFINNLMRFSADNMPQAAQLVGGVPRAVTQDNSNSCSFLSGRIRNQK